MYSYFLKRMSELGNMDLEQKLEVIAKELEKKYRLLEKDAQIFVAGALATMKAGYARELDKFMKEVITVVQPR